MRMANLSSASHRFYNPYYNSYTYTYTIYNPNTTALLRSYSATTSPSHYARSRIQQQLRLLRSRPLHFDLHRESIGLRRSLRGRTSLQSFHLYCQFERRYMPIEEIYRIRWWMGVRHSGSIALHLRFRPEEGFLHHPVELVCRTRQCSRYRCIGLEITKNTLEQEFRLGPLQSFGIVN